MSIEKIKQKLIQNSIPDSGWLEKAIWRQENEDWLDISFTIAVKILSALSANKKASISPRNQKELAEAMNCSAQYVNKLMRGQENLQIETICKVQRILGIKLIEIPKIESKQKVHYPIDIALFLEKLNINTTPLKKTTQYTSVEVEAGEGNYALAA